MKKKLNLKELKVQSFVTTIDDQISKTVKGKSGEGPCLSYQPCESDAYKCESKQDIYCKYNASNYFECDSEFEKCGPIIEI